MAIYHRYTRIRCVSIDDGTDTALSRNSYVFLVFLLIAFLLSYVSRVTFTFPLRYVTLRYIHIPYTRIPTHTHTLTHTHTHVNIVPRIVLVNAFDIFGWLHVLATRLPSPPFVRTFVFIFLVLLFTCSRVIVLSYLSITESNAELSCQLPVNFLHQFFIYFSFFLMFNAFNYVFICAKQKYNLTNKSILY